jgi:DNA-binding transcriptional MerR regulator
MVVMDDELMTIGAFSAMSGLSIPALRHYDEVDVLKPASVDAQTGYRRYLRAQLDEASLICTLRSVDLPIDEIREVLRADDQHVTGRILARHGERLAKRAETVVRMVSDLETHLEKGIPMPKTSTARIVQVKIAVTDQAEAVRFYERAFGVKFDPDYSHFQFGTWGTDNFFLLTLIECDQEEASRWQSEFGYLVPDVDAAHEQALAAGATQLQPPAEHGGMPRCSVVIDPSGNRVNLYQD